MEEVDIEAKANYYEVNQVTTNPEIRIPEQGLNNEERVETRTEPNNELETNGNKRSESKDEDEDEDESNKDENKSEPNNDFNDDSSVSEKDNEFENEPIDKVFEAKRVETIQAQIIEEQKIKKLKKNEKAKRSRKDNFMFILYTVLYVTIFLMQFDMSNRFKVLDTLRKFFSFGEFYTSIVPSNWPLQYFQYYLFDLYDVDYWFLDKKYELVSSVRTTIRKVKKLNSDQLHPIYKNLSFPLLAPQVKYGDSSDPTREETEDLILNEGSLVLKYDIDNSFQHLGGYVYSFKKSEFLDSDGNKNDTHYWERRGDLYSLQDNLDIALITFDFIIVNYELRYLCPIVISAEYSLIGLTTMTIRTGIIYKNQYSGKVSYIRTALEGMFFIVVIYYTYFLMQTISMNANKMYEKQANLFFKVGKKHLYKRWETRYRRRRSGKLKHEKNVNECNQINEKEEINFGEKMYYSYRDFELTKEQIEEIKREKVGRISVYYIKAILQDFMTVFQIVNVFISLICFIFWIIYVINLMLNLDNIEKMFTLWIFDLPLESHNSLFKAVNALDSYRSLLIINCLFLSVKIISIMSKYVPSTSIFVNTIKMAFSDLLSFFVFFICLLLGFTVFSNFFYGKIMENFNEFIYAVEENLSFTLGIVDKVTFLQMVSQDEVITLLYFLLIVLFLKFIVIKILLAIILHYFKISLDEYWSKAKDLERNRKMSKEGVGYSLQIRLITYFKRFLIQLCNVLFCQWGELKQKMKEKDKETVRVKVAMYIKRNSESPTKAGMNKKNSNDPIKYLKTSILRKSIMNLNKLSSNDLGEKQIQGKDDNLERKKTQGKVDNVTELDKLIDVKDVDMFNIQFNEEYAFFLRNPYFDSEKDNWKLKDFYEIKYKKIYIKSILFLLFLAVFILMTFMHTMTPWRKDFQTILIKKLTDENFNKFSYYEQINNIEEIYEVQRFAFDKVPNIFDLQAGAKTVNITVEGEDNQVETQTIAQGNYYFLRYNTLIQNKLLYTIKQSQFEYAMDYKSYMKEMGDLELYGTMLQENRTSFSVGDIRVPYNRHDSFDQLGGHSFVMDINEANSAKFTNKEFRDSYINNFLNFLIIEFLCTNVEYEFMSYVKIIIEADYGAYKQYNVESDIFPFHPSGNYLNIIEIVCEFIFVILLVYKWIDFFASIYEQSKAYNQWFKEQIRKLSLKTQDLRQHHKPELFRKLNDMLDLGRIIEFVVICLSTFLVYIRAFMYSIEMNMESEFNSGLLISKNIYTVRDEFYLGVYYISMFHYVATIIIWLYSIRIIMMIHLGKYFSLLIKTINDSKWNNLTFIVILLCLEPAFILYTYLAFGQNLSSYSSIAQALFSNLNMLFGSFYYKDFTDSDMFFGSLYFFTYLFMFNMILLNLFVAVVYSSYSKVKEEIKKTNEKWSFRRVFFFCCYRKNPYREAEKKNETDEDLNYDPLRNNVDLAMNIDIEIDKVLEEMEKEIMEIKSLDENLLKNKAKLKNMTAAFDTKKLGNAFSFQDNVYKDIEQSHIDCYNIIYLKKNIDASEKLEQQILTIEKYREHLEEYENYKSFPMNKEVGQDHNEVQFSVGAVNEKKIVELTKDIKDLGKFLEELNILDEVIKIN